MLRRTLLLAPAGVVVGHAVGYRVAGHGHGHAVAHEHLAVLAVLAVPLAIWGLQRSLRSDPDLPAGRGLAGLAAVQAVAFLALETLERAGAAAGPPLLAHPEVAAGLVAQAVVAAAVLATVRTTALVLDGLARPVLAPLTGRHRLLSPAARTLPVGRTHPSANRGRAPPASLVV